MLEALQAQFTGFLRGEDVEGLTELVRGGAISPLRRLEIHRANVVLPLIDSLAHSYPMTERLLGAENFRSVAASYVRRNPPVRPQLSAYGRGFSCFAGQVAESPWLADFARLEWGRHDAYFASNTPPLTAADLSAQRHLDPRQLHLRLHPTVHMKRFAYAVTPAWQSVASQSGWQEPEHRTEFAVVWRDVQAVRHRPVTEPQHSFLSAFRRGATLDGAADAALHSGSAGEFNLEETLAFGLGVGLFQLHSSGAP